MDGSISLFVVGASDLRSCDKNGMSDPYVRLEIITDENRDLLNKGLQKFKALISTHPANVSPQMLRKPPIGLGSDHSGANPYSLQPPANTPKGPKTDLKVNFGGKTTIKKKTLNPKWMELLTVKISKAEELRFRVMDWDRIGHNELCGVVSIKLKSINLVNQVPQHLELTLEPQGTLEVEIEYNDGQSLFGLALSSVVKREETEVAVEGVPHFLKAAIDCVERNGGLDVSGVYRVPGSLIRVQKIKKTFCEFPLSNFSETENVNDVCSAIKLYLREMPEPLFTNELFSQIMDAGRKTTPTDHSALIQSLSTLPMCHLQTIRFLFGHLSKVMANSDVNKMTSKNLATCFGPTLTTPTDQMSAMSEVSSQNRLVDLLLEYPEIIETVMNQLITRSNSESKRANRPAAFVSCRASFMLKPVDGVFNTFNTSGNGLQYSQFKRACYSVGGVPTQADFDEAVGLSGTKRDTLSLAMFEEWLWQSRFAALLSQPQANVTQAIEFFDHFDETKSGFLNKESFGLFHESLVSNYPKLPKDLEQCMHSLDANNDGEISLDEFLEWMLKLGHLDE